MPRITAPAFELQFPIEDVTALAARFPAMDERRFLAVGAAVRARGHYTRAEFIEVCAWKTPRSRPRVAANPPRTVVAATRRALGTDDEAARIAALPDEYPILDVRALESLGVKSRSVYPVSFWLGYLEACRTLARRAGVSLRTLDKALWQYSKENSVAT